MTAALDVGPSEPGLQSLQVDSVVYLFSFLLLLPKSKVRKAGAKEPGSVQAAAAQRCEGPLIMRIYLSAILKPLPVGPADEQAGAEVRSSFITTTVRKKFQVRPQGRNR